MMPSFELVIGIDYSGAETATPRVFSLRVFGARAGATEAEAWASPARSNSSQRVSWSRRENAERLREEVNRGNRLLAGIDCVYVDFVRYGVVHRHGKGPAPGQRSGAPDEFRLAGRCTSSAKSAFQFDEQDAYGTVTWMADMAGRGELGAYFRPPLSPTEIATASLEGWILGVR